jgi:hypothetical protein
MTYDNTILATETSTALTSLEEDLEELQKIIFEEVFETIEFKEEIEEVSFTPILTILKEPVMEKEEIVMEETKMEEPKTFLTSLLPP